MRDKIIIASLVALLAAVVTVGLYTRRSDAGRISELETQVDELQQKEKLSAIDRSISKQMEEIAYGQQALSEERSREAIRQSEIAQEMTLRSEAERKKALAAQSEAEQSAQEAFEAYQVAEQQRVEADEQRRQAEHAKQVTDTLNYISLARSLGAQSYSIYRAGDHETGNMLAYAAYLFTRDYNGDPYMPEVFKALTQSAEGQRAFNTHKGAISRIAFTPSGDTLLTASTYGELFLHRIHDGRMTTQTLMNNKDFCFRDILAARGGRIYAVSHTGHLICISGDKTRVIALDKVERPFNLQNVGGERQLLIIGERSIALFDTATERVITTRQLNFRVTCTGRREGSPLLFDDSGMMHLVSTMDEISNERVPVKGNVTAFANSRGKLLSAYGMSDGTIWLTDNHGTARRLVEHLSQVTRLDFLDKQGSAQQNEKAERLYSSSYDGKLLFWTISSNPLQTSIQIKPITLFQATSWLTDFTFNRTKDCIWTGEANGILTEYLISLPLIEQRIRQNLRRNFTQEEWNYYIGKGIPYREVRSGK